MNNDLETILDICLNQIEEGQVSVDECLARYPEHAAQLQPLLMAATRLARAREVVPSPSYRMRARSQLNVYMQQHPQRKRVSPVFWRVAISFATVMMLFLASGTAFAQQAVPGDTLYTWKLTSEHVWRLTSGDDLGVDIALSQRRMRELVVVSEDENRRVWAIQNYEELLVKFQNAESERDRARIRPVLLAQHKALLEAGIAIPELESYFPH
ncbi:MAG TPA: hypothetical protein VFG81_09340 [Anaerolineales bacterium]|jgi:hypothetical protein|nr:hypothetical protein [Anaerolineales bacterium]